MIKKPTNKIGVLGGAGPGATANFFSDLVSICQDKYEARQDTEFPEIFLYNMPMEGFNETGFADQGLVKNQLINGVQKLENWGADFIVLPCNTVHFFTKEMRDSIKIPLISIIESTVKELKKKNIKTVGILSSHSTRDLELYKKAFSYVTFGSSEAREQLMQAASQAVDLNIPPDLKQKFAVLARDEMQKQINAAPNDARYQIFMASFLNRTGNFNDAILYAERAITLSPKKQAMYFELATSYLNKKEYDKALSTLKTAFEFDQTYDRARVVYAMAAIYAGQNKLAEELLVSAYGTMIVDDDRLVGAYATTKQFDKLVEIWKLRVKANPENPQYHLSLAASYLQAGERERAVSEIQKVIDINPNFKDQGEFYIREIRAGRNP